MPTVYISPSAQEFNQYVTGNGSEEKFMNQIADAMIPYLTASGIDYYRNSPDMDVSQIIADANSKQYDLHVAIHSNASPEEYSGVLQGPDIYYYPGSEEGNRAAELVAQELEEIYPFPELVTVLESSRLAELSRTTPPSVYIETAYHDNESDAEWIENNIRPIARSISAAIAEYFGVPFSEPRQITVGTVITSGDSLNVRSAPDTRAPIIGSVANGQKVIILSSVPGWYLINSNGTNGYVSSDFIRFS